MRVITVACLLSLCAFSFSISLPWYFDPYTGSQTISTPFNSSYPISVEGYHQNVSILGGERDIQLTAVSAPPQNSFRVSVAGGRFGIATPLNAVANVIYQLDGVDGSMDLNPNGLKNLDMTVGGLATALNITVACDNYATMVIFIYGPDNGQIANYTQSLHVGQFTSFYLVKYASFMMSGVGNFSDVGAIEIQYNKLQGADVNVYGISIIKIKRRVLK